jgi:DNA polymerase elongation subunit (family B)
VPLVVAWDLETCPLPAEGMGPRQLRRLRLLVERERERAQANGRPFDEHAASRKARSLHGALGWICCASFARLGHNGEPRDPISFSAATPEAERPALERLWHTIGNLPRDVRWVTYNGKGFDCDFLLTRTLAHGLTPSRLDILHRHPYVHRPHLDLSSAWRRTPMGLDDVCELVGIESPKDKIDGSKVATAVENGRLDDVVQYCEKDVIATLRAYHALAPLI